VRNVCQPRFSFRPKLKRGVLGLEIDLTLPDKTGIVLLATTTTTNDLRESKWNT
jgi:hypothetical protein